MVMIMKCGMPTLVKFDSIEENVDFALKNHLDFIELNMDLPYCLKAKDLEKYPIEFTMHLSEELNVADLNPSLRVKYLNEAIRQIKMGMKNHISKFNIHIDSGVYFTLPDGKYFLNEKYLEIYKKHLDKSCKILNELAKQNHIEINFENTKIHDFVSSAVEIINSYEYLGFTLDIGHNEKNGDKAFPLFQQTHKIRHIHMHDYNGKSDHLAIGTGIIDFKKYKELLDCNYVVVEVKEPEELTLSIKAINTWN